MIIDRALCRFLSYGITGASLLVVTGCMVGPNYKRPLAPVPQNYKIYAAIPAPNPASGGWKQAIPDGRAMVRPEWWKLYDDEELNRLEAKVAVSNQTLKAAYQAYVRSRQQVRVDRSSLFSTVGIGATGSRQQVSLNRPFVFPGAKNIYSDMNLAGQVS